MGAIAEAVERELEKSDSRVVKRDVSSRERDKLKGEGKALPDGSFPIASEQDLKNAISAYGRAKDKEKAKRHIIKRARALKRTDLLPDDWRGSVRKASLARSPKKNWIENLPKPMQIAFEKSWIHRAAEHLHRKGRPVGMAIATAINAAKKGCATGDLNFPGLQQVNVKSRAEMCAAVALWESMRAAAKVTKVSKGGRVTPWEVEEVFKALGEGKGRGSNPRWPKGTPGIGGQWRPNGMPDGAVSFASQVLGQLDENNPEHKQMAKDFNSAAKDVDWGSEKDPVGKTKELLREKVAAPLKGEPAGGEVDGELGGGKPGFQNRPRGADEQAHAEGKGGKPYQNRSRAKDEEAHAAEPRAEPKPEGKGGKDRRDLEQQLVEGPGGGEFGSSGKDARLSIATLEHMSRDELEDQLADADGAKKAQIAQELRRREEIRRSVGPKVDQPPRDKDGNRLGSKEYPIEVGDDLEKAALFLTLGEHVRLEQPQQVSTLLGKLKREVDKAKERGDDAPEIDLCKVSVPDTNLFCAESKGIPRIKMPQLTGEALPGSRADKELEPDRFGNTDVTDLFLEHLKEEHGVHVGERQRVPAQNLRATQDQLNGKTVAGLKGVLDSGENFNPDLPFVVSRDDYIVDGHHRWAAKVAHDMNDNVPGDIDAEVVKVDMSITELLFLANKFAAEMGIPQKSVAQNEVHKAALRDDDCGCGSGRVYAAPGVIAEMVRGWAR